MAISRRRKSRGKHSYKRGKYRSTHRRKVKNPHIKRKGSKYVKSKKKRKTRKNMYGGGKAYYIVQGGVHTLAEGFSTSPGFFNPYLRVPTNDELPGKIIKIIKSDQHPTSTTPSEPLIDVDEEITLSDIVKKYNEKGFSTGNIKNRKYVNGVNKWTLDSEIIIIRGTPANAEEERDNYLDFLAHYPHVRRWEYQLPDGFGSTTPYEVQRMNKNND